MPPRAGLASSALPEVPSPLAAEDLPSGVSTRNALSANPTQRRKPDPLSRWYVLRATYGREKQAYDYMISQGITAFYPTIKTVKLIDGKRRKVTESRLPNIFFAYGTEAIIKGYVYDNAHLSYLRFYYRPASLDGREEKIPLVVPDRQMESLMIICDSEEKDTIVSAGAVQKFEKGQLVKVTGGEFEGFVGRVARYKGQQRVGLVIGDFLTAATTYVPSGLLKKIE